MRSLGRNKKNRPENASKDTLADSKRSLTEESADLLRDKIVQRMVKLGEDSDELREKIRLDKPRKRKVSEEHAKDRAKELEKNQVELRQLKK